MTQFSQFIPCLCLSPPAVRLYSSLQLSGASVTLMKEQLSSSVVKSFFKDTIISFHSIIILSHLKWIIQRAFRKTMYLALCLQPLPGSQLPTKRQHGFVPSIWDVYPWCISALCDRRKKKCCWSHFLLILQPWDSFVSFVVCCYFPRYKIMESRLFVQRHKDDAGQTEQSGRLHFT